MINNRRAPEEGGGSNDIGHERWEFLHGGDDQTSSMVIIRAGLGREMYHKSTL